MLFLLILFAGCGQNREPSSDDSASEAAIRVEVRFPAGEASALDIAPNANLAEIKTQLTPTVQLAIQTALDASKPESGELVRFAIVCQSRESETHQIEIPPQQQAELKMSLSVGTIEYRILLQPADGPPGLVWVTERRASETDGWRQINGSQVDMDNRARKIEPWVISHIVDSMADPIDTWNQFRQADLPL